MTGSFQIGTVQTYLHHTDSPILNCLFSVGIGLTGINLKDFVTLFHLDYKVLEGHKQLSKITRAITKGVSSHKKNN